MTISKGHIPWNKGKSHLAVIGNDFAKGHIPWNKGKKTGLAPWRGKKRPNLQRMPDIDKVCPTCGKAFTVKPTDRNQKACSYACRQTAHPGNHYGFKTNSQKGEKNVNWKGGVTSFNAVERIRFQRTMQRRIFKRDDYKCVLCGSRKSGDLCVDHIKRWSTHPELRFAEENCRTLCNSCHYQVTFGTPIPEGSRWGCTRQRSSQHFNDHR